MTLTKATNGENVKQMTATNESYIRHIHNTYRQDIREKFEQRYSISELFIMYRDVLHDSDKIALRQLKALTKGIKRQEKI